MAILWLPHSKHDYPHSKQGYPHLTISPSHHRTFLPSFPLTFVPSYLRTFVPPHFLGALEEGDPAALGDRAAQQAAQDEGRPPDHGGG